jgi:hypothetical protein
MTARQLATLLRTVQLTHDIPTLRGLAQLTIQGQRNDARDTLLHAIACKMVRLERSN